jgi:hypothetical protein
MDVDLASDLNEIFQICHSLGCIEGEYPIGQYPDGWYCDYEDDLSEFNNFWRTSLFHGYPVLPDIRGAWKIETNSKFSDDTYAFTNISIIDIDLLPATILYRIDKGAIADFKNYQVTATLSAGDKDRLGVVFYYQTDSGYDANTANHNNYYRLTFDNSDYNTHLVQAAWPLLPPAREYPHSISLTRHTASGDELLAVAPWPGTDHVVKPYNIMKLRVKVVTLSNNFKAILAQYFNPSIGAFVNLFDEIIIDDNIEVNYGYPGAYARHMGLAYGGGRLHSIKVEHIYRVEEIIPADPPAGDSDPYLLDYRADHSDTDGNEYATVKLKFKQYPVSGPALYWFIDLENDSSGLLLIDPNPKSADDIVELEVPPGQHTVYLYESSNRTGLAAQKDLWVSSQSAFTIAVLPDLHAGQMEDTMGLANDSFKHMRDLQIEGIIKEVNKRVSEDSIKACIQVGDMAMRGSSIQLESIRDLFSNILPSSMPIIATLGNHDYAGCNYSSKPMKDRDSKYPDMHILPVVTKKDRIKTDYGVETPEEIDNMYFTFDEGTLGGTGSGKWLVLSLQFEPMTRDIFWAEKIIKSHTDHNVILVTHQFLNEEYGDPDDNSITDEYRYIDDETNDPWGTVLKVWEWPCLANPATGEFTGSNSAKQIWDFLKKYDQIKIILDGHTSLKGGLVTKTITKENGSEVLAIMTDVSYAHSIQGAGGQFRLLEIDPEQKKIRGRMVYARTPDHIDPGEFIVIPDIIEMIFDGDILEIIPDINTILARSYYDKYEIPEQVINATHEDTYFIKEINKLDLPTNNPIDLWLFEDFNDEDNCSDPDSDTDCSDNNCLPADWTPVNATSSSACWHVDMSNTPGTEDRTPDDNETDVSTKMAKYGRVREVNGVEGTYLVYNGANAANWSDYTFELDVSAGDVGSIGVMFYYTGDKNYYRFSMNNPQQAPLGVLGSYSLEKVVNGTVTELEPGDIEQGNGPEYFIHTPNKVVVDLSQSGHIKIIVTNALAKGDDIVNNEIVTIDKEDSAHTKGTIALYSSGMSNAGSLEGHGTNSGAIFDNVLVTYDICPEGDNNDDADDDGIPDACDNCPDDPNGPLLGTCVNVGASGTCTDDADCNVSDSDGNCSMNKENCDNDDKGDVCDPDFPCNWPPVCDVNGPYTAECQGTVTTVALDGTGSSDPEDGPLSYMWVSDCPGATFDDNTSSTPGLTIDTSPGCSLECTITLTVTDDYGLSDTCSTTVTVQDTTPPVLSGVPADATVECNAVPEVAEVSASDNCDQNPNLEFNEERIDGNCPNNYVLKRTWTATDVCNNQSSSVQTLTVQDTTPPVLSGVPADATVECDAVPEVAEVSASDNCDQNPNLEFNQERTDGNCPNNYVLQRTWTATDVCNNQSSAVQILTVQDTTPPVLSGVPVDATVECDAVPEVAEVTASDNCDQNPNLEFSEERIDGDCPNNYVLQRTWTATDVCNNQSSAVQILTVQDTTPPEITCPEDIEVEPTSSAGATVTYEVPVGSDNCPGATTALTEGLGSDSTFPIGTTSETYTATDACDNATSCTFTVKVLSPEEVADKLIERIEGLVSDGTLTQDQGDGLIDKLTEIIAKLESAQPLDPACNQLVAFINQVEAFMNAGFLTALEGQTLIDSAINAGKGAGCTGNPF